MSSSQQKRYEYQKTQTINKTVNFNRNTDDDLIGHIEDRNLNFSGYVKDLIRMDLKKKHQTIEKFKEDGD